MRQEAAAFTRTVFHDPDDPARAFIVPPELAGSDLMLIAAGLAALGFGCYKVSEWHFLRAFYRAHDYP